MNMQEIENHKLGKYIDLIYNKFTETIKDEDIRNHIYFYVLEEVERAIIGDITETDLKYILNLDIKDFLLSVIFNDIVSIELKNCDIEELREQIIDLEETIDKLR